MSVVNLRRNMIFKFLYYSIKNYISPLKFATINLDIKAIKSGFYSKHNLNNLVPEKIKLKTLLINPKFKHFKNIREIESNFSYPLILKPDWGESSLGVIKIENKLMLKNSLLNFSKNNISYLIQEYSNLNREFDILYINNIKTNKKSIIEITEILKPTITGDGVSNIKDLINKNFKFSTRDLISLNKDKLEIILTKNKKLKLTDINSLLFGSNIININSNFTSSDKKTIMNNIGKIGDFKVAKVSIKAKSVRDIVSGNFKVIEINILFPLMNSLYDSNMKSKEKQLNIENYLLQIVLIIRQSSSNQNSISLFNFYIKNYLHKRKLKLLSYKN